MTEPLNTGSHDLPVSDALAAFMSTGWADTQPRRPGRGAARRLRRQAARPRSPPASPASGSSSRPGRSRSAATTATTGSGRTARSPISPGDQEPGDVLVIEPYGRGHAVPAGRARRGPRQDGRPGVLPRPPLRRVLGGPPARPGRGRGALPDRVRALGRAGRRARRARAGAARGGRVGRRAGRAARRRRASWRAFLSELRLVKDEWEVAELQHAVRRHRARASRTSCARCPPALGAPPRRALPGGRLRPARPRSRATPSATTPSCASGAARVHAALDPQRRPACAASDLLLLDAGVETDTLYTADITRTLPVNGRFSPIQRQIYELVLRGPGGRHRRRSSRAPRSATSTRPRMRVLAEGLDELGRADGHRGRGAGGRTRPAPPLDAAQHRPHARPGRARLRQGPRARPTWTARWRRAGAHRRARPVLPAGRPDAPARSSAASACASRTTSSSPPTAPGLMSAGLPRHPDEVEAWMATLLG